MAVLTPITINKKQLKNELKAFNHLLNDPTRAELKENQDILPFFDANKNLCAFMGNIYNSNILAIKDVSIAREFDVFGRGEKEEAEAAFLIVAAAHLHEAQLGAEEIERGVEIADADHGVEIAHGWNVERDGAAVIPSP